MYGGTTVEVLNTDAEGRLVLADALVRADRAEARRDPRRRHPDRPHGASRSATGSAGVLGSEDVVDDVLAAGEDGRRGAVADADPGGDDRADPQQQDRRPGPARLDPLGRRPVRRRRSCASSPTGMPWAHLDIAGPAFNTGGAYGHVTAGGTGFAVGDAGRLRPGARRRRRSARGSEVALRASCAGCSRASAAGCRPPRRRTTARWCLLQKSCAHSTDGTRRRVHSPSCATSSSVTSLTAVRGSTKPSTPRRAVTKLRRCSSSARSDARTVVEPVRAASLAGRRIRVRGRGGSGRTNPWAKCANAPGERVQIAVRVVPDR